VLHHVTLTVMRGRRVGKNNQFHVSLTLCGLRAA